MSNPHILFWSNKCPHCREFIQLLDNSKFHNVFKKYCIEHLQKIPNGIFEVPTIIVPGINLPLSGENVFKWFQQNTQANTLQTNLQPEPPSVSNAIANGSTMGREEFSNTTQTQVKVNKKDARPNFSEPPSLGKPIEEPSPFGLEMSSKFSDIYSYLENGENGLVHSFEYLNGGTPSKNVTNSTPRLPAFGSQEKSMSKGDILNKKYEDFMESRNNDPACQTSHIKNI